jgi:hypothetical protein
MIIVDVPFTGIPAAPAPNALVIVGGATTVKIALAVVPVPSLVELTAPVVFDSLPGVELVTVALTVQELPGVLIEPPLRLMLPEPTVFPVSVPPVQVVEPTVEMVMPAGKVSLTPIPFIAPESAEGSVMVRVSREVPPVVMDGGVKLLAIVGGAATVKVADAVSPVPPFAALAVPVVLL